MSIKVTFTWVSQSESIESQWIEIKTTVLRLMEKLTAEFIEESQSFTEATGQKVGQMGFPGDIWIHPSKTGARMYLPKIALYATSKDGDFEFKFRPNAAVEDIKWDGDEFLYTNWDGTLNEWARTAEVLASMVGKMRDSIAQQSTGMRNPYRVSDNDLTEMACAEKEAAQVD